jgi:hypothetical protein
VRGAASIRNAMLSLNLAKAANKRPDSPTRLQLFASPVVAGSRVLQYFAITAAWAGEKELALQQLEAGLRAPVASLMLSYGALKLHPL